MVIVSYKSSLFVLKDWNGRIRGNIYHFTDYKKDEFKEFVKNTCVKVTMKKDNMYKDKYELMLEKYRMYKKEDFIDQTPKMRF
jgi:hypothetical protein